MSRKVTLMAASPEIEGLGHDVCTTMKPKAKYIAPPEFP